MDAVEEGPLGGTDDAAPLPTATLDEEERATGLGPAQWHAFKRARVAQD